MSLDPGANSIRYLHDLSGLKQTVVVSIFAEMRGGAAGALAMSDKSLARYLKGDTTPNDPNVAALLVRVYIREIEMRLRQLMKTGAMTLDRDALSQVLDEARDLDGALRRSRSAARSLETLHGGGPLAIKRILVSILPSVQREQAQEVTPETSPEAQNSTRAPNRKVTYLAMSFVLGLLCGAGGLALVSKDSAPSNDASLIAPSLIKSHETPVWGQLPPKHTTEVVLYVKPEDGRGTYYRDLTSIEYRRDRTWIAPLARFGNRDVIDMSKPPPLDFQLYAAFAEWGRAHLPGTVGEPGGVYTTDDEFRSALKRAGALQVLGPRIVHRIPATCDGRPVISRIVVDNQRVVIEWRPPMTAFVEIRRDTVAVAGGYGYQGGGKWQGDLTPGRYDVTLRTRETSDCFSQEAFEVSPNKARPAARQ